MPIRLICDMCASEVQGAGLPKSNEFTSGYYHNWYGREITCDHCMWTRVPEYERDYGKTICNCDRCVNQLLARLMNASDNPHNVISDEDRILLITTLNKIFKR